VPRHTEQPAFTRSYGTPAHGPFACIKGSDELHAGTLWLSESRGTVALCKVKAVNAWKGRPVEEEGARRREGRWWGWEVGGIVMSERRRGLQSNEELDARSSSTSARARLATASIFARFSSARR
jgi:hypothetical protein